MLPWPYEKSHLELDAPRSHERASGRPRRGSARGAGWSKGSGLAPPPRRATSGMDRRGLGRDPHEPEPVDPRREQRWARGLDAQAEVGTPHPISPADPESARPALGAVPASAWAESRAVGRADGGGAPEAALRGRRESPTGAAVDALPRVPSEAGQLLLPAGARPSGRAVPAGVKKNWRPWARLRPWSSRTRRGSPCTRAWVGGGPDGGSGSGSRPPVSIASG